MTTARSDHAGAGDGNTALAAGGYNPSGKLSTVEEYTRSGVYRTYVTCALTGSQA